MCFVVCHGGFERIINLTLPHDTTINVMSPGFPSCCSGGAVVIEVRLVPRDSNRAIYLKFSDLDIPENSIFLVKDTVMFDNKISTN